MCLQHIAPNESLARAKAKASIKARANSPLQGVGRLVEKQYTQTIHTTLALAKASDGLRKFLWCFAEVSGAETFEESPVAEAPKD